MLEGLSRLLWGWHVVILILGAGAWFTWESGFFQIRAAGRWLGAALSCAGEGKKAGGLSRLQALATGLAGSLGTGNIVGVGVALAAGGPGALFWMALSALLGMMTVFGENVLAARHRGKPGPLGYLERAGGRPLAWVYALGCCLSALVMGNMVQTGAAAAALSLFQVPPWGAGVVLGLLAFLGAWGGLGKGARALEKLVPLMTLLFFAGTLALLWRCRARIPAAFVQIFQKDQRSRRLACSRGSRWIMADHRGLRDNGLRNRLHGRVPDYRGGFIQPCQTDIGKRTAQPFAGRLQGRANPPDVFRRSFCPCGSHGRGRQKPYGTIGQHAPHTDFCG